jgi:hypothetical protein
MSVFHEAKLGTTPIRDLGLTIAGTPLEPLVRTVEAELAAARLRRLRPRFYLSTEWGIPTDTLALAIPFYLARPELTELHAERTGHVEGLSGGDILRYLRHELGHVVCYAYALHEERGFIDLFGSITQPYLDDYRPEPFSTRYVVHLPGWYAQKHPEEDWAETFAVWLTPGRDWRAEYADQPIALAKLAYCDRTIAAVGDREPCLTTDELDEDVARSAIRSTTTTPPTPQRPSRAASTPPCARSSRTSTTPPARRSPRRRCSRASSATSSRTSTGGPATSPRRPGRSCATSPAAPTSSASATRPRARPPPRSRSPRW